MINLDLADQQPAKPLQWPDGCKTDLKIRREIERDWQEAHAPAQQQMDEIAALRSTVAQQAKRIEALEAAMKRRLPTEPVIDGICQGVAQMIKAERKDVNKRFDALDKRVGDGWRYRGVWTEGCAAAVGDVFTCSGSLWYCRAASTAKPGADSDAFTLAAKRGRDARDLPREPVLK